MKKLVHYPNVWQTYPFSMDLFAHVEKEARLKEREKANNEKKTKFKLALGW